MTNPHESHNTQLTIKDELTDFLLYTAPNGKVKVEVILHNETVWLTQKAIAALFGVQVPAISKHMKNVFENGELQESSVVSILETTASDGKIYQVQYYNLDAIISVGYRVNSRQATNTLKEYISRLPIFLPSAASIMIPHQKSFIIMPIHKKNVWVCRHGTICRKCK